jgi:orotate phosphoribosyltransferase
MSGAREELIELLLRLSYLEGDFVLASGRRSDYLVDVKRTVLHPRGGQLIGRAVRDLVRATWPEAEGIGGRTLGADPLAVCAALTSLEDGGRPLEAFIVRKEAKGHGASQQIVCSGGLLAGASVVVLDDVVTTGGSALQAVEAARGAGYRVVGVVGFVDRDEGGRERIEGEELPFRSVMTAAELRAHAR